MRLILFETSGNQNYIFATNRLRENVGASELTFRSCTQWVIEAVAGKVLGKAPSAKEIRAWVQSAGNPAIEKGGSVEVIVATSGKAILLVNGATDHETVARARQIIQDVTLRALKKAPGLDIRAVYSDKAFDLADAACLIHGEIGKAHRIFERQSGTIPGPDSRFARLPVVAECRTSGLTAASMLEHAPGMTSTEYEPASRVSQAKRDAAEAGLARIANLVRQNLNDSDVAPNNKKLADYLASKLNEKSIDGETVKQTWLGVAHADGNGLGQLFLCFNNFEFVSDPPASAGRNRHYINTYRHFSIAVEEATEAAFLAALRKLRRPGEPGDSPDSVHAIVPLILGGDDFTAVCDGERAIPFTRQYLLEFEAQTRANPAITAVAGSGGLSACAGVSVVKPHFPFWQAYDLAEDLASSAKQVKTHGPQSDYANGIFVASASALDFQVNYETSGFELGDIRRRMRLDPDSTAAPADQAGRTRLFARPYVVSQVPAAAEEWLTMRKWCKLAERVAYIAQKDDEGRLELPNSQTHALRDGLFSGVAAADARYRMIKHRYDGIDLLEASTDSLFWTPALGGQHGDDAAGEIPAAGAGVNKYTHLLDAVEAAGFIDADCDESEAANA